MNVVGIGTEIIECVRIARMIQRHGELFLERVYTADEVDFCSRQPQPIQHYAASWAAKEATVKALRGRGHGVRWNQIEVTFEGNKQGPQIKLTGCAAHWARQCGIGSVQMSYGSCRTHATAFAIALAEPTTAEN